MAASVEGSVASLQGGSKQPQVHGRISLASVGAKRVDVGKCRTRFLFHAGDTRSRAELVEQLEQEFSGVLSSDDFSVYNGYPVTAQQNAWHI